jgi:hypothetical protein
MCLGQSILLISYPDQLIKAQSIVEISASIGSCTGPFIGTGLNYLFGIDGPFIIFCNLIIYLNFIPALLYLLIFPCVHLYIPDDKIMDEKESEIVTVID